MPGLSSPAHPFSLLRPQKKKKKEKEKNYPVSVPLAQIHFVSGERLITDPAGEMGRVQDFLGILARAEFSLSSFVTWPMA